MNRTAPALHICELHWMYLSVVVPELIFIHATRYIPHLCGYRRLHADVHSCTLRLECYRRSSRHVVACTRAVGTRMVRSGHSLQKHKVQRFVLFSRTGCARAGTCGPARSQHRRTRITPCMPVQAAVTASPSSHSLGRVWHSACMF